MNKHTKLIITGIAGVAVLISGFSITSALLADTSPTDLTAGFLDDIFNFGGAISCDRKEDECKDKANESADKTEYRASEKYVSSKSKCDSKYPNDDAKYEECEQKAYDTRVKAQSKLEEKYRDKMISCEVKRDTCIDKVKEKAAKAAQKEIQKRLKESLR